MRGAWPHRPGKTPHLTNYLWQPRRQATSPRAWPMAISHDDCQDDQSCENGIWHTLFWAFSDGVRLLWMVVNAQEHHKCVSNQSCLTRSWQQDGVSVGVPSDVIDRWRILWIFGFGHHTDHKGCRHNQEKSAFASKITEHYSFWCFYIKVNPWNLFVHDSVSILPHYR